MHYFEVDENGDFHKVDPPTACKDIVCVVRCKDCYYRALKDPPMLCRVMGENWYCADGRKKD